MVKKIVKPAGSAPAAGPYSHGVGVDGTLYCAGQVPVSPETGKLVEGGIRVQTERALENVKLILQDQGLTMANVVKTTVYMTDLADFAAMNEVYGRYFVSECPARTTVQVAALPRGASIEIEAIARY
jgi:2-iminobutanoate/2-iminopropanoate deaminase